MSRTTTWNGAGPPPRMIVLFEKLCLEGFQSGLSWLTILRKRPAFRMAFAGFDPRGGGGIRRGGRRPPPGRRRDRPPPGQDPFDYQQRQTGDRVDRGQRFAGVLLLAVCRSVRSASAGGPRHHRNLRRLCQGLKKTRLHLRRSDDGLRLHAGHGPGQRPSGGMSRPGRLRRKTTRALASLS